MIKMLIKLLSINPLFSLFLVVIYIFAIWKVAFVMWGSGHELLAVLVFVLITVITKLNAKAIIDGLKSAKADS
jgi:hypothetical protein